MKSKDHAATNYPPLSLRLGGEWVSRQLNVHGGLPCGIDTLHY